MQYSINYISQYFIILFLNIQAHFEFVPDWHKKTKVCKLVLQYNSLLCLICKMDPKLNKCVVKCKYCGIFFLTYFCTCQRNDLGCPFGCQEANRKKKSNKRSSEYHRNHKVKKKQLNENRYRLSSKKTQKKHKEKINPTLRYLYIIIGYIERSTISYIELLSLIINTIKKINL